VVLIPDKIVRLIRKEQLFVVATADKSGICNVSPRTTFFISSDGTIFWLELFKHKTYRNLQKNPWCSIAVFDKKRLGGYQIKGKVSIIKDKSMAAEISTKIIDRLTRQHKQRILKHADRHMVARFEPKIVYSLNPNELADSPLGLEATEESLNAANMQW
jgi:predicted pyridoxine 5'-phosphate oxidase superfamily flavin-nucleotide-binding protein